jgi:hypothetical protein
MASTREIVLGVIERYGLATVRLICLLTGLQQKNVERILAFLRHDGKIRSFWLDQRTKVYTLTSREAIRRDLDPRRFRRAPTLSTIRERLTILAFCVQQQARLYTPAEFAAKCGEAAAVPGFSDTRYFRDRSDPEQPIVGLIVPGYGHDTRRICRRARGQVEQRKQHKPWQDIIHTDTLRVWIAVGTEPRAKSVRRRLNGWTALHQVVVVPEIQRFTIGGKS